VSRQGLHGRLGAGCSRVPRARHVDNDCIKFRYRRSTDYRLLLRQFFRWLVPNSPFCYSALDRLCNQLADFFAWQGHKLVRLVFIELWAKVHGVNSRVISVNDKKWRPLQQPPPFHHDFSLLCCPGNTQTFRGGPDDCAGLQQNQPVLAPDIVRMYGNEMAPRFSSKNTHWKLPQFDRWLHSVRLTKEPARSMIS
jgi:hypothetical protein